MRVELSPLLPDVDFSPLPNTIEAMKLAFEAKRDAMRQHIEPKWGWDESYQLKVHQQRFDEKPFSKIAVGRQYAGVLAFQNQGSYFRFGEFYLFGDFRARGLGSRILKHCLMVADEAGLPVRLEYLKWSQVGKLYSRFGFKVIGENEIHFFMERAANGIEADEER